MQEIYDAHTEFVGNFDIMSEKIGIYRLSILDFLQNLFGSGELFDTKGLKIQLGCGWVGEEIRKVNKNICAKIAPIIFNLGLFVLGMGFLACCGMECSFYINRNMVLSPE